MDYFTLLLHSNVPQIAFKPITQDVWVINGYVVEFGRFPEDHLINVTTCFFAFR